MQDLEERSGGRWRPSPGSVYPTLSQLEDEGLIEAVEADGKKAYSMTPAGRKHVEEHRERMGTPWAPEGESVPDELHELRRATEALAVAGFQVGQTGHPKQLAAATEIIEQARRALYRVLAEDSPKGEDE
jgi:DNA-binding PadR family transcriptional regulator